MHAPREVEHKRQLILAAEHSEPSPEKPSRRRVLKFDIPAFLARLPRGVALRPGMNVDVTIFTR